MIVEGEAHHMCIAVQLECQNLLVGVAPYKRMIYIRVGQCLKTDHCQPINKRLSIYLCRCCASNGHIFSECNYGGASCKKEDKITILLSSLCLH